MRLSEVQFFEASEDRAANCAYPRPPPQRRNWTRQQTHQEAQREIIFVTFLLFVLQTPPSLGSRCSQSATVALSSSLDCLRPAKGAKQQRKSLFP